MTRSTTSPGHKGSQPSVGEQQVRWPSVRKDMLDRTGLVVFLYPVKSPVMESNLVKNNCLQPAPPTKVFKRV